MAKEIKIGLITLISGLILYFGFNYLKGSDLFSKTSRYYVVYDNVDGLTKSNPVIISGLNVGKVNSIKLLQSMKNKILVEIVVDEGISLGDSTIAELSSDLFGNKSILLKVGPLTNKLQPRDTLKSYVDEGLSKYLESVEPVANSIIITITRINEILLGLEGSGELIYSSIARLDTTLAEVNELIRANKGNFKQTMDESRKLVKELNSRVQQLDPVFEKTNIILDSVAALDFNSTLEGINALIAQSEKVMSQFENQDGTLGKLVNNDSLYNNLNQMLFNLDLLIIHLNNYPRDFTRPLGRKEGKMKGARIPEN